MAELRAALEDLGRAIEWPGAGSDVTGAAVARLRAGEAPRPRRRWVARVAVGLAAATLVAGPAIAERLGVDGVRIRTGVDLPADIGTELTLGTPVDLRELPDVPAPIGVGPPSAAFAGRPPGGVTYVWAPSAALPEVLDTGVGLLLTSFPGRVDGAIFEKRVVPGGQVLRTTVDGAPAWWVAALHGFVYVDPDGHAREDTLRLSGSALLWSRDGRTHRLESALSLDEVVALIPFLEQPDRK